MAVHQRDMSVDIYAQSYATINVSFVFSLLLPLLLAVCCCWCFFLSRFPSSVHSLLLILFVLLPFLWAFN